MKCPFCGKELKHEALYCPFCGNILDHDHDCFSEYSDKSIIHENENELDEYNGKRDSEYEDFYSDYDKREQNDYKVEEQKKNNPVLRAIIIFIIFGIIFFIIGSIATGNEEILLEILDWL